jgi:PAS domain S-box-containing protein
MQEETGRLRILLCEDSEEDAILTERALSQAGVRSVIRRVWSQKPLEDALRGQPFDIALIDYYLPGFQGEDALKLCLEIAPEMPVIFVSGMIREEKAIEALKLGATDYVLKNRLSRLPAAVLRAHEETLARREKTRTEERLRETELFLQTALEVGRIGSWSSSLTGDGNLIWSRGSHRIFGLDPKEERLTRDKFFQMVHPDDLPRVVEKVERAIAERADYSIDHRVVRADGKVRWVHEQGRVICDDKGRPLKLIGVAQDVTERKESEEKIREQAALLDIAQNAILTHSMDGSILYWNQTAEQLYGWKASEAVGRNVAEILYAGNPERFREIRAITIEGSNWHGELQQLQKNGRFVSCDSRWTVVRDGIGRPTSILSVNTDLTDRKRLEQQFLRAQRMECVGTLASGIAHDINNVLAPVMMSVELFRAKLTDAEDQELLDNLEASAKRGADIVRQVLTFARGADGQRAPVQLRRIILEISKILRETLPKSIEIDVGIAQDLWPVRGDATQLYQVLMNLSVNARDAMKNGGQLTISAANAQLDSHAPMFHADAKPGPHVELIVKDSGTGIPAGALPKIFDPFFTTKEVGQGTGLGLSTVLSLVRGHGGFILVNSKVAQGTEMKVYLPAEANGVDRETLEEEEPVEPGEGQVIMVVDDEATIRIVTRATLEANGYNVLTAKNGAEAIELFKQNVGIVKVVITDLMMPAVDGPGTIRAIHEIDENMRFIAVSGMMETSRLPNLPTKHALAYLSKPFSAGTLLRLLRETLRK